MKPDDWPQYLIPKRLVSGEVAYYWNPPVKDLKNGCPLIREAYGSDQAFAIERARERNIYLKAWRDGKDIGLISNFGTVDWWFDVYLKSDSYLENVDKRSRPDYERNLKMISDMEQLRGAQKGQRIGILKSKSITAAAVNKIYKRLVDGGRGQRYRTANYATDVAKIAWTTAQREYPKEFVDVNPFVGLRRNHKTKSKPAVNRDEVYQFSEYVAEHYPDRTEIGFAAIVCFEWMQRPENVLSGYITWNDIRSSDHPNHIRILHHKTETTTYHPLEDDGELLYPEAEEYLSCVHKRGTSIVLAPGKTAKPYAAKIAAKWVRKIRGEAGLPQHFTLDACRHGGITELEEAELTEGQGMALTAHKSKRAYRRYPKHTERKILGATRRRRAWVIENK